MHKLLCCSANKLGDKAAVARSVDLHASCAAAPDRVGNRGVLALGGYRLARCHRACGHTAGTGWVTPHGMG
jgi:hypothetical protein